MKERAASALVIDDEIQIRRLLRVALEAGGYVVREADSGQLGLAEVALSRPDVVLLDLGLPDIDGLEVLRRLREWSEVPVLVLTVRNDEAEKIAKPVSASDDPAKASALATLARIAMMRGEKDRAVELQEGPAQTLVVGGLGLGLRERGALELALQRGDLLLGGLEAVSELAVAGGLFDELLVSRAPRGGARGRALGRLSGTEGGVLDLAARTVGIDPERVELGGQAHRAGSLALGLRLRRVSLLGERGELEVLLGHQVIERQGPGFG